MILSLVCPSNDEFSFSTNSLLDSTEENFSWTEREKGEKVDVTKRVDLSHCQMVTVPTFKRDEESRSEME